MSSFRGYLIESSLQKNPRLKGLCSGVSIANGSPAIIKQAMSSRIKRIPLASNMIAASSPQLVDADKKKHSHESIAPRTCRCRILESAETKPISKPQISLD